jgi:hypothetical protein
MSKRWWEEEGDIDERWGWLFVVTFFGSLVLLASAGVVGLIRAIRAVLP